VRNTIYNQTDRDPSFKEKKDEPVIKVTIKIEFAINYTDFTTPTLKLTE
jgi:hypothetical protein